MTGDGDRNALRQANPYKSWPKIFEIQDFKSETIPKFKYRNSKLDCIGISFIIPLPPSPSHQGRGE
jgi:hypothetical protein